MLVVRGSVDAGVDYRIRRGDGITLGEDEILALADVDAASTPRCAPWSPLPPPTVVKALADAGIEYVVLPSPADGTLAAGLDATAGLDQASAEDRSTRAWKVDRPLQADDVESRTSAFRIVLLIVQGLRSSSCWCWPPRPLRKARDDD